MASAAKVQKIDPSMEYIYQYIPEVSNEMAASNIEWFKRDLFPLLERRLKGLDELRILAIGSGAGVSDCVFLKELFASLKEKDMEPKITYTVVEPDEKGIKTFEHHTSKEVREDHKELTFDWHVTTMEEYLSTPPDKKFHIVHFIHSLCSRKRCKVVLPGVLKTHLDDKGIIFAVLGDPNDLFMRFFLKYVGFERYEHHPDDTDHAIKEREKGDEHHQDKSHGHHHHHHHHHHAHDGGVEDFDFEQFAEENGYNCLSFVNEVENDVTEVIKRSPKGMKKLEGLFDTHDVTSKLSEAELNEVIDKIRDVSKTKTVDGTAKQYVMHKTDVAIMWKED